MIIIGEVSMIGAGLLEQINLPFTQITDDSCSELSSDEDLSSARIFTEVDVKNPPVPCPRFKFSGIPSVHIQFDDTSDVLQFYETFIDFSLMSKIVEETN
ncbi:uncharacterized protein TNCT_536951 [Trichonephila clavata]|uniref:Uncharacterized protein n=1 Tax=Trichonephila clavata TaxID=2740835 RepID=A0A8X6LEJ4_TRICU|nr:uncharacterized protein TNCT_536951 [Trichonephila clavata]